jgi:hypothetical protein
VTAWCNDLYVRIHEDAGKVAVSEVQFADRLVEEGEWMHPNLVSNQLYHLLDRLGRPTPVIDH